MPSHGEDFRSGGATVLVEDGGIVGVEPVGYEPPSDCDSITAMRPVLPADLGGTGRPLRDPDPDEDD